MIKSSQEIVKMRAASQAAAEVLDMITPHVVPGISTGALDTLCHDYIVQHQKNIPAPLNYRGFPKSICTSINQVICHGVPNDSTVLKSGDIINIDVSVIKDGYYGDTSKMFAVDKVAPDATRLIRITQECLYKAIALVQPGASLGDIGHVIQQHAEGAHYSVVRDYCGHGIGTAFHEAPQVAHYGRPDTGMRLKAGMTFTIEPMINQGSYHYRVLSDAWTVVTKDRRLSAQWEHTLLVTQTGVEVLSRRQEEIFPWESK